MADLLRLAADAAARSCRSPMTEREAIDFLAPQLANQAPRIAEDVARDLALPLAEVIGTAWRSLRDHALFDSDLEDVRWHGEEVASTAAAGAVLGYASTILLGRALAAEAALALTVRSAA